MDYSDTFSGLEKKRKLDTVIVGHNFLNKKSQIKKTSTIEVIRGKNKLLLSYFFHLTIFTNNAKTVFYYNKMHSFFNDFSQCSNNNFLKQAYTDQQTATSIEN